jgi:hypothetical protein
MSEIDLMRIVLPDLQPASGKEQNMIHGKPRHQLLKEVIESQKGVLALAPWLVAADKAVGHDQPFNDFEVLLMSQVKLLHTLLSGTDAEVETAMDESLEPMFTFASMVMRYGLDPQTRPAFQPYVERQAADIDARKAREAEEFPEDPSNFPR